MRDLLSATRDRDVGPLSPASTVRLPLLVQHVEAQALPPASCTHAAVVRVPQLLRHGVEADAECEGAEEDGADAADVRSRERSASREGAEVGRNGSAGAQLKQSSAERISGAATHKTELRLNTVW